MAYQTLRGFENAASSSRSRLPYVMLAQCALAHSDSVSSCAQRLLARSASAGIGIGTYEHLRSTGFTCGCPTDVKRIRALGSPGVGISGAARSSRLTSQGSGPDGLTARLQDYVRNARRAFAMAIIDRECDPVGYISFNSAKVT